MATASGKDIPAPPPPVTTWGWLRARRGEWAKLAAFFSFYTAFGLQAFHQRACQEPPFPAYPCDGSLASRLLYHALRPGKLYVTAFFSPSDPADYHDAISLPTFILGGLLCTCLSPAATGDARKACPWRFVWLLACVLLPKSFSIAYGLAYPTASLGAAISLMLPRLSAVMLWISFAFPLTWKRQAILASVYVVFMLPVITLLEARGWPYEGPALSPRAVAARLVVSCGLSVVAAAAMQWRSAKTAARAAAQRKAAAAAAAAAARDDGAEPEPEPHAGGASGSRGPQREPAGAPGPRGGTSRRRLRSIQRDFEVPSWSTPWSVPLTHYPATSMSHLGMADQPLGSTDALPAAGSAAPTSFSSELPEPPSPVQTGGLPSSMISAITSALVAVAEARVPHSRRPAAVAARSALRGSAGAAAAAGEGPELVAPGNDAAAVLGAATASLSPGVRRRYRSSAPVSSVHLKLEGADLDQVTPDVVAAIASGLGARGFVMTGLALRSGCVELLLTLMRPRGATCSPSGRGGRGSGAAAQASGGGQPAGADAASSAAVASRRDLVKWVVSALSRAIQLGPRPGSGEAGAAAVPAPQPLTAVAATGGTRLYLQQDGRGDWQVWPDGDVGESGEAEAALPEPPVLALHPACLVLPPPEAAPLGAGGLAAPPPQSLDLTLMLSAEAAKGLGGSEPGWVPHVVAWQRGCFGEVLGVHEVSPPPVPTTKPAGHKTAGSSERPLRAFRVSLDTADLSHGLLSLGLCAGSWGPHVKAAPGAGGPMLSAASALLLPPALSDVAAELAAPLAAASMEAAAAADADTSEGVSELLTDLAEWLHHETFLLLPSQQPAAAAPAAAAAAAAAVPTGPASPVAALDRLALVCGRPLSGVTTVSSSAASSGLVSDSHASSSHVSGSHASGSHASGSATLLSESFSLPTSSSAFSASASASAFPSPLPSAMSVDLGCAATSTATTTATTTATVTGSRVAAAAAEALPSRPAAPAPAAEAEAVEVHARAGPMRVLSGGRADLREEAEDATRAVRAAACDRMHWGLLEHVVSCGLEATARLLLGLPTCAAASASAIAATAAGGESQVGDPASPVEAMRAAVSLDRRSSACAYGAAAEVPGQGAPAQGEAGEHARGGQEGSGRSGEDGARGAGAAGGGSVLPGPTLLHLAVASGNRRVVDAVVAAAAAYGPNGHPCGSYGTWSSLARPSAVAPAAETDEEAARGGTEERPAITPLHLAAAAAQFDFGTMLAHVLRTCPDATALYGCRALPRCSISPAELTALVSGARPFPF